MIKDIRNYLSELGFNRNEASVYLALTKLGEAKASQVAKTADLPRTTAISVLNKLAESGYITTHVYRGTVSYWIESPQVLLDGLNNKLAIAEKLKEMLPNIYHTNGRFPVTKVFDTKKGIKNFIEKTLSGLEKGTIIYTIDTPNEGNYSKIFSEDFSNIIFNIKKKRGVVTKTLIPAGSLVSVAKFKLNNQNIIIKELPSSISFQGSFWLIKDMVINFSGNPPFLVATKHEAIVSGLRGVYNFLWNIATNPIKNN